MTERHSPRHMPTMMEKVGQDTLRFTWDDGMTSDFNVATLRRACPCASCVDEWTGKRTLDPFTVLDAVRPMSIDPVGRYAIKISWTDGHDTGIYTFEYLRALAEGGKAKGR